MIQIFLDKSEDIRSILRKFGELLKRLTLNVVGTIEATQRVDLNSTYPSSNLRM